MQRFFFDQVYVGRTDLDEKGSTCPHLAAARREACAILRELSSEALAQDPLFAPMGISICSERREQLAYISTTDAINEII